MASPRNILISIYDWGQDPASSIPGGSFEPQLPAENMLKIQPQMVAQSTGSSDSFTLNLGGTRSIGLIHLQRLITDPGATITVTAGSYAATVNAWATDAVGVYSGLEFAALGRPRIFIPPTPVLTSSVNVSISGSVTPLQIGYVGACEVWEPRNNLAPGWKTAYLDESDTPRVPFGSTYVTLRGKRRRLSFGLAALFSDSPYGGNDTEISIARQVMAINGMSSPIIVVPRPDSIGNVEREAVWGLQSNAPELSNPMFPLYDATFQIDQLI